MQRAARLLFRVSALSGVDMRVAIVFDGKNFYAGWRASNRPRIDFPALARWLVERAGGTSLWGAHYYTTVESGETAESPSQESLRSYLDMLELQPGYFVHRWPRKPIGATCQTCGAPQRVTPETGIDTAIAAEAVRLAAVGAYDALVLVSGDGDHAPIVEAVRSLGRQVFVATWGRASLSRNLRLAAFDHIDFLDGVAAFVEGAEGALPADPGAMGGHGFGGPGSGAPGFGSNVADPIDVFVQEVRRAEEKFDEGYVGLHYFLTRWKSDRLDTSAETRRRTMDEAVDRGVVEIYDAPDGAKAVRAARRDGGRGPRDPAEDYDFGEED